MSKIRVALIEDHDLTRVGLRTGLKTKPEIEVVGEAATGAAGLKLLQETQPDVAIIDIGLPDMDGIEVTQQLKESLETKVLMLTLKDNEEVVLAAFAAGADSYCMKDAPLDTLWEAVRVTFEGYSWIDPAIAHAVLRQTRRSQLHPKANLGIPTISIDAVDADVTQLLETTPLTDRELEVLALIVEGCSNAAIAEKLFITVGTVKTHVRNILNKLCTDDRTQAAVRALRAGLVS
jgi:two-component system, NarL family, response regulator LiaR